MTQKKPRLLLGILPTPESLRGFFQSIGMNLIKKDFASQLSTKYFNKKRLSCQQFFLIICKYFYNYFR